MTLHQFAPWSPLTPRLDALLTTPLRAFCEQIICVYRDDRELGWWHDLETEGEGLFAEGGRIVESTLDALSDCIDQSVHAGYRPLVFVPAMSAWAPAYTALARYQAFGEVYVAGRDDAHMAALLSGPSREILAVLHGAGRIVVPVLDYGKALDGYLPARLEDFILTALNQEDPLTPRLSLVCRLNPYRHIDVSLDCRKGIATLVQTYRAGGQAPAQGEPCPLAVPFRDWSLNFGCSAQSEVRTGGTVADPAEFAGALAETFDLPLAYRGWTPGEKTSPWEALLHRLLEISRGVMEHLPEVEKALVRLVDITTLKEALCDLDPYAQFGLATGLRRAAHRGLENYQAGAPRVLLVRQSDADTVPERPVTRFGVIWLDEAQPEREPAVIVKRDQREVKPEDVIWGSNLASLTLVGVPAHDTLVGWSWVARDTLCASFETNRD